MHLVIIRYVNLIVAAMLHPSKYTLIVLLIFKRFTNSKPDLNKDSTLTVHLSSRPGRNMEEIQMGEVKKKVLSQFCPRFCISRTVLCASAETFSV